MAIGDFNAKSSKWHCQDKSTFEGNAIDNITSQFGLWQVIKEPAHLLNISCSCIDLTTNLFEKQLANLIGQEPFQETSQMRKLTFLITLFLKF